MLQIEISKANGNNKSALPLFAEITQKREDVRHLAFARFQGRGFVGGPALEDWLAAEREVMGCSAAKLIQSDEAFTLEIALPGVEARYVEISATPNEIAIHAAICQQNTGPKERVLWTEFATGDVYRLFEMPIPIRVASVSAKFENGLLTIIAPVAGPPEPRSKGKDQRCNASDN
jgi:HSP20 family molecular chaperone IbpA